MGSMGHVIYVKDLKSIPITSAHVEGRKGPENWLLGGAAKGWLVTIPPLQSPKDIQKVCCMIMNK